MLLKFFIPEFEINTFLNLNVCRMKIPFWTSAQKAVGLKRFLIFLFWLWFIIIISIIDFIYLKKKKKTPNGRCLSLNSLMFWQRLAVFNWRLEQTITSTQELNLLFWQQNGILSTYSWLFFSGLFSLWDRLFSGPSLYLIFYRVKLCSVFWLCIIMQLMLLQPSKFFSFFKGIFYPHWILLVIKILKTVNYYLSLQICSPSLNFRC